MTMALLVAFAFAILFAANLKPARGDNSFAAVTSNATAAATTAVAAAAVLEAHHIHKMYGQLYHEKICANQRSCHLVHNVSNDERTLAVRNCMCDVECNTYGDCCFDSEFYNDADQKANFERFYCPKEQWYMKAECAPQFADREIRAKCADAVRSGTSEPGILTPVTDVARNVTYANVYCAVCDNRDPRSERFRAWNVTLKCGEANASALAQSPERRAGAAAGGAGRDGAPTAPSARRLRRAHECAALRRPPAEAVAGLRRCAPVVSSCPPEADVDLADKCRSFTLFVHDDSASYRNVFCAQCSGATRPLSGCRPHIEDRFSTPQRLFSLSNKATGNSACDDPKANPDLKKRFCPSPPSSSSSS